MSQRLLKKMKKKQEIVQSNDIFLDHYQIPQKDQQMNTLNEKQNLFQFSNRMEKLLKKIEEYENSHLK